MKLIDKLIGFQLEFMGIIWLSNEGSENNLPLSLSLKFK